MLLTLLGPGDRCLAKLISIGVGPFGCFSKELLGLPSAAMAKAALHAKYLEIVMFLCQLINLISENDVLLCLIGKYQGHVCLVIRVTQHLCGNLQHRCDATATSYLQQNKC